MSATDRPDVLLVDPSLFTEPYDAALDAGLRSTGLRTRWAVRPVRPGDRAVLPPAQVDAFFYRRVDQATHWHPTLQKVAKGLAHALGLVRLVGRVWRMRPGVVHFQWTVLPLLDSLAIALIRLQVPVVLTVHDSTPFNGERISVLQNLAFDLPLRLAAAVIVHTQAARETLLRRGLDASRVHVVAHGPLALQAPADAAFAASLGDSDGRCTLVLFGEIKPYKGLDVLIEAMAVLPATTRRDLRVIVAGRPRMDLAPLLQRIQALGLGGSMAVHARRLSEPEMAALFERADGFVFPYRQIDASGVYFLVKGLRKWMVASQVGIFAEDLADGIAGRLVPPKSAPALADALAEALARHARGGEIDVPAGASWADIGQATRQVYAAVARPHTALAQGA